ncbi:MAG: hydantoinase/oxoprolinase family protein, partial [Thalassolituus sp.]
GAGGQHACAVAAALGMSKVYLHPMAGVLSAYGIGIADQRWLGEEAVECLLDQSGTAMKKAQASLAKQCSLEGESNLRVYLRYEGADTPLLVQWQSKEQAQKDFEEQHKRLFGFIYSEKNIVLDALQ